MVKKILYIEDNPNTRRLIRGVLEGAGYMVIEAADGLGGIKTAEVEHPDLVLIDINIPSMDGYEVATRLKSLPELKNIPVIALTAGQMAGDRERALTAGCDGYIAKPIDTDRLPQKITEFLSGLRETVPVEEESTYLREHNQRLVDHLQQKVQELTTINEGLSHTDAMKSRFINLAAHELRTPLAALSGYLSLLTAPNNQLIQNADQDTLNIISGIVTSVDRLRGIVQDMLDVTRIETGTLQLNHTPVNMSHIFEKIAKFFKATVTERQQNLIIANANHVPLIWADGERITQTLRNLIGNAIKYTPDGGKIEVTIDLVEAGHQIHPLQAPLQDQSIRIVVTDTGVGIPPEKHERIFESFYEVRNVELHSSSKTGFMGGGTGLGLPIARGVAIAHGGSLLVESEGYDPEQRPGSKFYLILPVGQPPTKN